MKLQRILGTLAFLSMFTTSGVFAQTATPVDVFTAEVAGVNVKTVGGADAASQAIIARTAAQSLGLAQQNAVANQQTIQSMNAKMLAQTTIVSPTEGSKAVETVQESGDSARMAQILAILGATLQSRANAGGGTAP